MTITDPTASQAGMPPTPAEVFQMARRIGMAAAPHAARHDREASFVTEGYEAIRAERYGSIAVPAELGGGGHDLATVCHAQSILARHCANTALAIAMHQHNVLTLAWRWRLGDRSVEPTLRRIVTQELILSSSGSADTSNPGVTAVPAGSGLVVTGRKRFCSGVPGADVVATMARVEDRERTWITTVLIPMSDPGSEIIPDWDAMGMRGSGSNPVAFSQVFVPAENVIDFEPLRRRRRLAGPANGTGQSATPDGSSRDGGSRDGGPVREAREDGHRLPGLQIALAVIASVYLGAAGGVRDNALRLASAQGTSDPVKQRIAGLLTQEFWTARWVLDALIDETDDLSLGTERHFNATMLAKRQVVLSSVRVAELATELLGSRSYMRLLPFEQALRDMRAAITHPLAPEKTLFEIGHSVLEHFASQRES
jgi:alkylation response protein AidB-like acyl-CoA dehydrogenase